MGALVALAVKDLRRSVRSLFLMGMAFAAPLAICAIIAAAFAGSGGEDFEPVRVALVDERPGDDETLRAMWEDKAVGAVLAPTRADTLEAGRALLEDETVEVVVVLDAPEGGATRVRLYADAAGAVRPHVAEAVFDGMLDVQHGAVVVAQGAPPQEAAGRVAGYFSWLSSTSAADVRARLDVQPPDPAVKSRSMTERMKARVILAQLVFFAFFGAAFAGQTLLREEEEGTWTRLRATAQPLWVLLAGKALFVAVFVSVQTVVFLVAAPWLFGIDVGSAPAMGLSAIGLVSCTTGLGLALVSLIRTNKQGGPLIGAAMPLLGMLGGLFTAGVANLPPVMEVISLATPTGWAFRAFDLASSGARLVAVATTTAVCIGIGIGLATFALWRFRRRYAPIAGAT